MSRITTTCPARCMWEFYLAGAEMSFRYARNVVFQFQLAKRLDALPLTRDYMLEAERIELYAPLSHSGGYGALPK